MRLGFWVMKVLTLMKFLCAILSPLFLSLCAYAQPALTQPPASNGEVAYFRFLLLGLGHLKTTTGIHNYERLLAKQFDLNPQEVAVIDAAGVTMRALLQQIHTSLPAIESGQTGAVTVARLTTQREQMITTRANQILNSVRPITAARLRVPGHLVANATNGGN